MEALSEQKLKTMLDKAKVELERRKVVIKPKITLKKKITLRLLPLAIVEKLHKLYAKNTIDSTINSAKTLCKEIFQKTTFVPDDFLKNQKQVIEHIEKSQKQTHLVRRCDAVVCNVWCA